MDVIVVAARPCPLSGQSFKRINYRGEDGGEMEIDNRRLNGEVWMKSEILFSFKGVNELHGLANNKILLAGYVLLDG